MMTLLKNAGFRRVALAGLVSLTGDWVLRVGLAFLVYDLTGSTLATGATLLAAFVPQVALGSVAGVLVDRWDRRRTMVACDLLRAVMLLPLVLVTRERIWIVYAVAFAQSCASQFFEPAEHALVPLLVPADDLLAANALNGQSANLARLTGSSVGGVVAAAGGLAAVALVDAGTFLVSAALLARVAAPAVAPRARDASRFVAGLLRDWRSGLDVIRASRGLRTVLAVAAITSVGEGVMATLMAPWVRDVVHGDGRAYGLILGVQAVGGVAGGVVAASVARTAAPVRLCGLAAVTFGLLDLVLFTYPLAWPHVAPALGLMVVIGVPAALSYAGFVTILQGLTEDAYRGRVRGAIGAVQGVAILVGIGAASWLGDAVGILPVIVVQGFGYVIGGTLVLLTIPDLTACRAP